MRKTGKKLYALLLAASMAALTACGGGSGDAGSGTAGSSAAPAAGGETQAQEEIPEGASVSQETDIVAAVNVDFTTMDPMDTSDTLSGGIQRMISDSLFGFDDDMDIIPMLATGYEANDNATEFTITLREGISFTDGTPWDADAALANFAKWDDESLGLKRTTFLCNVLDSFEKVDEYTIKVTLTEPFGAFISNLAHPACVIMSPKTIEAGVEECARNPVGTGQYKFVEWIEGDHLTLELNKDWWGYDADICGGTALADKDAGFKTITFKPVPESATRVAMIQSGDAQLIWPIPTESVSVLESDPNVTSYRDDGIVVRYMMMNTQKEPLNNVKVRQAMDYAVNKEAYIQVVDNGMSAVATSIIGPAVQYYKGNEARPYDPEKAKALLEEAGYPNGFTTSLMYANTTANQKRAEFLKQQLEQVGITLELKGMESAVLNQKIQDVDVPGAEAEVECYIIGWSPSTGDADWGIRPLVAIESEPPMSYNICYFENQELEGYIKTGLESADDATRKEAYEKAQDLLFEEMPMLYLSLESNTWATGAKLQNVKIYPDGAINMKNAKMAN
ncbi:glutathione ABC transporter substrate-binding protein [bacterium D16-54]|nr:glutathione ABC transporter substrate-binding protein [bacterium D16-54]RKJ17007.1 glutathione ABC transporter substrate-binding protein [bacterium D16-56]